MTAASIAQLVERQTAVTCLSPRPDKHSSFVHIKRETSLGGSFNHDQNYHVSIMIRAMHYLL